MADVYNPDQDEDSQKTPGQIQQVPSGMGAAPAGGVGQSGGGQTVSGTGQGGQSQQSGSGRFTNIQKYLKANEGNQIGQQLGQKVQEEAATPMSQIGAARDQLQTNLKSEQDRLGQSGDLFNRINQYATSQPAQQQQGQTPQPPPQLSDADYAAFAQYRQGQANVPGVDNMQDLEAGANKITDLSNAAGSEQGRFGLLNQFYGRPTYNTGQQRLDQLLLQNNPTQAKALQTGAAQANQDAQAQLGALKTMQTEGTTDLANKVSAAQTGAQSLIGDESQGTGLLGGLVGQIKSETSAKQGQADAARAALTAALSGKGFGNQEEADKAMAAVQAAGIDPSQYQTYDISKNANFRPEQFLNNLNINENNVASQDERAKLGALYKLAGTENPTFLQGEAQAAVDPSTLLNSKALQQASLQRKNEYGSAVNAYGSTGDFSKALTSGKLSPSNTINNLVKYGLSPENAQRLLGSKEFAGQPGGPGMHANVQTLDQNIQYAPGLQEQLNTALAGAAAAAKQQYGVGTTLKDLLSKYQTIPTQGTNLASVPKATGPAGQIGLL